ncbi:family 43 glycosylhydrolase [Streptomyces sp. NPDC102441]|uniref:family 43 glycosylhydrolase n=1 Tax=Streptomyces sp. NPDC102441 TaxID=3366176 RepID=UPI0037FB6E9E
MRTATPPEPSRRLRRPPSGVTIRLKALLAAFVVIASCLAGVMTDGEPAQAAPKSQAAPATFTNPLNSMGPDPWMTYYKGNYYMMATPWNAPLTMRKAPTIAALKKAAPVPVFNDFPADRCCSVWAPEFHLLNGPNGPRWYIYYSAGDGSMETQRVHVLESSGTDPLGPYTYKGMVFGSEDWWGIDGSVVNINNQLYLLWSGVSTPKWAGSDPQIYIARMSNPWTVSGSRTAISTPTYDWEKSGVPMNEGPEALQHDGKTFITYSASACSGPDYKLGLLTYSGGDVLSAGSWAKSAEPVFQRSDANGVFGPGHNGFFTSPDGTENWIVYHANAASDQGCGGTRSTRIQKFTWNADGTPDFGTPAASGTALEVPSGEPTVTYQRITNRGSGKVIDVQAPNTDNRTPIGQYGWNGAAWQQWRTVDSGNGYTSLESLNSGKCLDVLDFSTADGASVIQWPCHGGANQQFQWVPVGDHYQLKNRHSGKCLTVVGGSTADGARLEQRTCGSGAGFEWSRQ